MPHTEHVFTTHTNVSANGLVAHLRVQPQGDFHRFPLVRIRAPEPVRLVRGAGRPGGVLAGTRLDVGREGRFSFRCQGGRRRQLCISPCFRIPGISNCC